MRRTAVLAALLLASVAWAADLYKVGDTVADQTLTMGDGKDAKLSSWDGNVVVLHFYGTWQKRAGELAGKVDSIRKARAKQKLKVVGVARDGKAADAKKFGEDNKLGFPQAADPKAELYGKFASKGLPYVVVMDDKRKLTYSAAGVDEDALEAALAALLGAKDPPPEKDDKKKDEKDDAGAGKK
jgi:peroxiredoxin